jgi:hypothetical protein
LYLTQRATSYCLYKHRSRPIVIIINTINQIYTFHIFCPSFLVSFPFCQLDLSAAASTSKVVVVYASPPSRCRMAEGRAPHQSPVVPLTIVSPNKTEQFSLPNWTIRFAQVSSRSFWPLFILCANRSRGLGLAMQLVDI